MRNVQSWMVAVVLCAPLFSLAQNGKPRPLDQARDAWQVCLMKEVIRLDDGVSPISDIGSALQMSCEREYKSMVALAPMSMEEKQLSLQEGPSATKDVAMRMTLDVRAKRRGTRSN